MCCLLNIIPTNPKYFSLNWKTIKKGSGRCRTHLGPAQTLATFSASPGQSASPSPIPTSSWSSKLLDFCPELQCGPLEWRIRTESSQIPAGLDTNWRDPFRLWHRHHQKSKGLRGPSRRSRSYSCPEPIWVASRRGRGRGNHTGCYCFQKWAAPPPGNRDT